MKEVHNMVDYDRSHERGAWNKESIPTELKSQNQWLIAKITASGKPPLYPRSPTAIDRGLSFDDVIRIVDDPDLGFVDTDRVSESDQIIIGFMIAPEDDYYFIDWDDVRDPTIGDRSVPQSVVEWVSNIGGYTEVSPSGTGLKTICRSDGDMRSAKSMDNAGKTYLDHPPVGDSENKPHIDVYVGPQYTTVTGNVFGNHNGYQDDNLSDGCSVLAEIEAELQPSRMTSSSDPINKSTQTKNSLVDIGRQSARQWQTRKNKSDDSGSQSTDGEWIKTEKPTIDQIRATGCALDDTFESLWDGNVSRYSSVSEADEALVSRIWYYANNRLLVNEAFQNSNLYGLRLRRPGLSDWSKSYPKWDEKSYRWSTLKSTRDNDRHQGHYLDPSD